MKGVGCRGEKRSNFISDSMGFDRTVLEMTSLSIISIVCTSSSTFLVENGMGYICHKGTIYQWRNVIFTKKANLVSGI